MRAFILEQSAGHTNKERVNKYFRLLDMHPPEDNPELKEKPREFVIMDEILELEKLKTDVISEFNHLL